MFKSIHKPVYKNAQQNLVYKDAIYDPISWITGTPTRSDNFTTLASGATFNGRALTGTGTWLADAAWTGAGDGEIKCSTGAKGFATNFSHSNAKLRVIWHPGIADNNIMTIVIRNSDSNTTARYGYLAKIHADGTVTLGVNNNFAETILVTTTATVYRGYNSAELRCVGNTLTVYVNGSLVITQTDDTHPATKAYAGFMHNNRQNDQLRVSYVDFTTLA